MKENLTNISPEFYNNLFSNKKSYNKENKYNKHIFPRINSNSLSPSFNKTINMNSTREKEANYAVLSDRTYKHKNKKILNFYKTRNIISKGILHLKEEKYKKYGLSVKNIELKNTNENNYDNKLYKLKDLNTKNIINKKNKNNNKIIINKKNISKLIINNLNNNFFPKEINIINDKNKINYTERNLYKDKFINNNNDKKYKTFKNFSLKQFGDISNYDNKTNIIANKNHNGNKSKISTIFLKLLSNSILHQVELNNQSNKKISLEIVKNLLNEEIDALNNKNKKFLKEEMKSNLYIKNISENKSIINKSNYNFKKNNLLLKEMNFEKINDKNKVDSNKRENYIKEKEILSKFKSFDLYTDTQMFDEKYFIKNNNLTKLYIENREELLNDVNVIKEIGDTLSLNSNLNKSRNQKSKLFSSDTNINDKYINNNLEEKFSQTELENIDIRKLRKMINNIIFQTSYNLKDNIPNHMNKDSDKKNSFNINNIIINGINCSSIGDIYKKLYKNRKINKKGIHKFKFIKNKLKDDKRQDRKENAILNNYLFSVENINKRIQLNNMLNNKSEKSQLEHLINFNSSDIKSKSNRIYTTKNSNIFTKSSSDLNKMEFNKYIDNINKGENSKNNIENSKEKFKHTKNKKIMEKIATNKNISTDYSNPKKKQKNTYSKNSNLKMDQINYIKNKNFPKKNRYKKEKLNENKNENENDNDDNDNNGNNSFYSFTSSNNEFYSFVEREKNESEEIGDNKEKIINKKGDKSKAYLNENEKKKELNNFNTTIKSKRRNSRLKRKMIENIQHNNLTKTNKKNKHTNNKIIQKNNLMKLMDKKYINQTNKLNVNEIIPNNNDLINKKSKSSEDLDGIFSFNIKKRKIINSNNKKTNDLNNSKNQKKNIIIKKEVQEILNNNINLVNNSNISNHDIEKNYKENKDDKFKAKYRPSMSKSKKKKFQKIKKDKGKNINDLKKNELINKEKTQEEFDKETKDKIIEQKMYQFFKKIQTLKNTKIKNYEQELNLFIDEEIGKIKDLEEKDREIRINTFYREFELNRKKEHFFKKFQKRDLVFISPLKFSSTSPNFKKII